MSTYDLSPDVKALGDYLMANDGKKVFEIRTHFGWSEIKVAQTIRTLTFRGYLWEDGSPARFHFDHWFKKSMAGNGDLLESIFGITTQEFKERLCMGPVIFQLETRFMDGINHMDKDKGGI